ncbi:MAG: quinone-dependent dihydroorotate dehydrogenase [Leptolyngbyaceae cyanobacterium MO_188.B28]|nr:quinone-dependent dihydroorotate dehydrogenase [Leptolyngbyaceae cyanobacterium MO_188.B28]
MGSPLQDTYRSVVRPLLFSALQADPEWLHQQTIGGLARLSRPLSMSPGILQGPVQWGQSQLRRSYCLQDERLRQTVWGVDFPNPVGLAAGFDKDGIAVCAWPLLGFGFAELGTVTFHAQPGNPRPRLFRLLQDRAALNRMGFNNRGAAAMAAQLEQFWRSQAYPIPLGINLGKSKITPLESAVEDYVDSFRLLQDYGDYFVVNVSSPNTPGLRSLQAKDQLEPILAAIQQENQGQKPLLVKISPDLDWDAIAEVSELAQIHKLAGIIATNTTIQRQGLKSQLVPATGKTVAEEPGGLSGAPLRQRSTEVIQFIWRQTNGRLPIIGVGGVFTAEDAWRKITAGASLLQVYTGWIYEGPGMVRRILEGLLHKLAENDLASISAAVGLDVRQ